MELDTNCASHSDLAAEWEFKLGTPIKQWGFCVGDPKMARLSLFRIQILVGCDGLEKDAASFTLRKGLFFVGDPSCKLCGALCEIAPHFISQCSSLSDIRTSMLSSADRNVRDKLPNSNVFLIEFMKSILGINWINHTQEFLVVYLTPWEYPQEATKLI